MRRVDRADELASAIASAKAEAAAAFGYDRVLLERLIEDARHIEIQILGDDTGAILHLGERDCSAQRRHQKIVEEAPSPAVDAALRERMGADAVKAARAVNYRGAGTVEFIASADGSYHFLEMNTRIQVEHPVTEMVTGVDLVEWQIRIAAGEPMPWRQEDVRLQSHAIQARIYAEDPGEGFLPQTGTILAWRPEEAGTPGIRVDAGVVEGDAITPHYDPMIAKVIAEGTTRDEARGRLADALRAMPLFGVVTNRDFLIELLETEAFSAGEMTTGVIDRWVSDKAAIVGPHPPQPRDFALAAAVFCTGAAGGGDWFRSAGPARIPMQIRCGTVHSRLTVVASHREPIQVEADDDRFTFAGLDVSDGRVRWMDGSARACRDGRDLWLEVDGRIHRFHEADPLMRAPAADDPTRIVSPVTGLLRSLTVAPGDRVEAGQAVATVEAMKMETVLVARAAGVVASVAATAGMQVKTGDAVVQLRLEDGGGKAE